MRRERETRDGRASERVAIWREDELGYISGEDGGEQRRGEAQTASRLTADIDEFSLIQIRVQLSLEWLLIEIEHFEGASSRTFRLRAFLGFCSTHLAT